MDNSNSVTGNYQFPASSSGASVWPKSVTDTSNGLDLSKTHTHSGSDASAQSFLQSDRISFSGMRLIANGLTPFQLYRLETILLGPSSTEPHGVAAGQAALMAANTATANPQDGLQSHIAGQMVNPIIPKQSVRLPENITPSQQIQATESASQATQRPGVGAVPLQDTNAAVNSVLNKRPVQELNETNVTESKTPDESLFDRNDRSIYRQILEAAAFTKSVGNSRDAQHLGIALPVRHTKIMKKPQTPRSEHPTFEIPPIPTEFVPLARSIPITTI